MSEAPNIPTAAVLIEQVKASQRSPEAFQALWDGDSDGWGVDLEVVFRSKGRYQRSHLVFLRFGGDVRLFHGAVPPWPEAKVAAELGTALAEHFGVPFWFPSPTEPDDDCPSWWEQDRAHHCEDCDKLILPRNSPHLPQEVCFSCHLRREERAKLRGDEPASATGVTVLFGNGEDDEQLGYATQAVDLMVARFALQTLRRADEAYTTGQLVLAGDDVQRYEAYLRTESQTLLDSWELRSAQDTPMLSAVHRKVMFEGRELDLEIRFDDDARKLYEAISELETARRAIRDGLRYWLVFRKGMTARTDRVIRLLRQLEGDATIAALVKHCDGELDESEMRDAVSRLTELGHVVVERDSVRLTPKGRHV